MADNVTKWVGVLGAVMTAGTLVWQTSGIAHDVDDIKAQMSDMRTDEKARNDRLSTLEWRVVKLETSVNLMEKGK
jgi:cell division protein FtsB